MLQISRPTLSKYVKERWVRAQTFPNGLYEYNDDVVITFKDRLSRVGFELFKYLFVYFHTEIVVISETVNEAYTSRCSFLDREESNKENYNKNRRIKRGLFRTDERILINADVNSAYNIIRKAIPNVSFTDGIESVVLHPIRLNHA